MKTSLVSLFSLAILTVLPSCTTFDPYTGDEKATKTAIGASIVAGVGAVVAYLDNKDEDSRKRNRRILAAAGGGATDGDEAGGGQALVQPALALARRRGGGA